MSDPGEIPGPIDAGRLVVRKHLAARAAGPGPGDLSRRPPKRGGDVGGGDVDLGALTALLVLPAVLGEMAPVTMTRAPTWRDSTTFSASSRQTVTSKKSVAWTLSPLPLVKLRSTATQNLPTAAPEGVYRSSGSRVMLPTRVTVCPSQTFLSGSCRLGLTAVEKESARPGVIAGALPSRNGGDRPEGVAAYVVRLGSGLRLRGGSERSCGRQKT